MKFLPSFLFAISLWWSGFFPSAHAEDSPLPAPPPTHVLDKASVFQPAALQRLEAALEAAADKNVGVYVVTLQELGVPSSKQQEELERQAKRYIEGWIGDIPGAVLVFDDRSGLMSMQVNDEATRRFSEVSIHFKLTSALKHFGEAELSRDKLEKAAATVADVLVALELDYEKGRRRQIVANTAMGVLALAGVILAIRSALRDDKTEKAIVAEAAEDELKKSPPSV